MSDSATNSNIITTKAIIESNMASTNSNKSDSQPSTSSHVNAKEKDAPIESATPETCHQQTDDINTDVSFKDMPPLTATSSESNDVNTQFMQMNESFTNIVIAHILSKSQKLPTSSEASDDDDDDDDEGDADKDKGAGDNKVQSKVQSQLLHQDSADGERSCWICFATDEDNRLAAWVQPCKCRGTTKWVHQSCLYRWVDEKQKGNALRAVNCQQCQTEYIIVFPQMGKIANVLEAFDNLIKRVSPFLAAGIFVGSLYWTAVTYGAVTFLQVVYA